jgi:hypothetical protein
MPTITAQHFRDPLVAITPVRTCKDYNRRRQRILIVKAFRLSPLGRTILTNSTASLAIGNVELVTGMVDEPALARGP